MERADADVEQHLQSGLSRIREAGAPAPARAESAPEVRRQARRARRARKARRAKPKAMAFGALALVALYVSLVVPSLWWLAFVALGSGAAAAVQVLRLVLAWASGVSPDDPALTAAGEPAATAQEDARVARVRAICDELVTTIETGPAVLRRVVQRPRETIEGLRDAFVVTARRERELRAALGTGEAGLVAEREALERRMTAEGDPIVRERLAAALRAFDEQLAGRAELARAAARLEAESTRILYTLESLRLQLLRARSSADEESSAEHRQVRQTLESLSLEIDAVAEALEHAPAATPAPAGARGRMAQASTEPH